MQNETYFDQFMHNFLVELGVALHSKDVYGRKGFVWTRLRRFVRKAHHALIVANVCAPEKMECLGKGRYMVAMHFLYVLQLKR